MSSQDSAKSRRSFIKKSAAGLAGAAILPSVLTGETKTAGKEAGKKKKMIYRTLGKTGLKLPIVSMGVMNADNPKLVEAALDAGILLLDTAWFYQMGRNEEMIGKVVKSRPRDSYVLATKVWEPRDRKTGLFPADAKADTFMQKFETSMKRLGLDHVDILYLHSVYCKEAAMFEPYLEIMQKLKKQGRIRFIGVSTHRNEPEVLRAAADSKIYDVVLTSYNFKMKNLAEVEKAIDYAAKAGVGIVAMKTQAGVFWDKEKQHPINMKAALKWALKNENIHTSIPGFTTFDQLELDLAAMEDLTLTPEEKAGLKEPVTLAAAGGLYCQQCEQCLPQCRGNLEIPTLMRSYMYAYGYKNFEHAKQTLEQVDLSNLVCDNCGTCNVKC
ncbi:MAG: twin-arginine translocation signal domain-containing protein, partial [bacterium]|nr:twin-arginine translocation signal domain-containing protein [bacterium]